MSKEIKIPSCRNPFVVFVNGMRYEYESGTTVEVPDEVAEVIKNHEDSKPMPAPDVGGGSSGGDSAGGGSGWIEGGSLDILKNTFPSEIMIAYEGMDGYGDRTNFCNCAHLIRLNVKDGAATYIGFADVHREGASEYIQGKLRLIVSQNRIASYFEGCMHALEGEYSNGNRNTLDMNEQGNWQMFEENYTLLAYKP